MATEGSGGATSEGKPRTYTGQYLKDILARSERVESASAMKLGKARAKAPKREREAAE
jgi:hypothetical protein